MELEVVGVGKRYAVRCESGGGRMDGGKEGRSERTRLRRMRCRILAQNRTEQNRPASVLHSTPLRFGTLEEAMERKAGAWRGYRRSGTNA